VCRANKNSLREKFPVSDNRNSTRPEVELVIREKRIHFTETLIRSEISAKTYFLVGLAPGQLQIRLSRSALSIASVEWRKAQHHQAKDDRFHKAALSLIGVACAKR
jgi:hypothetical protein